MKGRRKSESLTLCTKKKRKIKQVTERDRRRNGKCPRNGPRGERTCPSPLATIFYYLCVCVSVFNCIHYYLLPNKSTRLREFLPPSYNIVIVNDG